ncbi:hypothetical protein B0675_12500 [Streptomyces sp. M41(2017)]|uniref:hypothetical protein n=1 Tax=Streptomyces sp. M41(2017) TaxID=1955065 RepID=UPI0009C047E8|nr:hypothetical protein [Streptomyces sp. M41(2017)]OQQ17826.1 hypothetical protein B0675_12500 [Streptomyces sp. M41(2017)]
MAYEMFRSAPETNAAWAALPAAVRDGVARCDAERHEAERSRVAPELGERITSPLYSVAERFASWERVVRHLEPGWTSDDFHAISAYENDLDSRDSLGQLMKGQLAEAQEGALGWLLSQLGQRFVGAIVPAEHSLLGASDQGEARGGVRTVVEAQASA